jgi:hypothetical protein
MSKEALAKVIQRSISDGGFRRQLATDPTGALRGYDLTKDEAAAIRSGDATGLTALGVEQRMSKAFTLGGDGGSGSSVSYSVTSDLNAGSQAVLTGSDGALGSGALTTADGSTGSGALVSGDSSDTDPMIAGGNDAGHDGAVIGADPAHAFGYEQSDDFLSTVNTLTPGDPATHDIIVSDDGASGASTPGEALGGNEIQE